MENLNINMQRQDLMNINEVSLYLRIPLKTVYHLAKQEKIKGVKIGKHWRFLKQDIDYYLQYGINKNIFRPSPTKIEKRAYPRLNTNFKCRYSINLPPFKNFNNKGIIKNLSAGGILLIISNHEISRIETDDPINLDFNLSTKKETLNIKTEGKITRKTDTALGIKFRNLSNEDKEKITQYVG